MWAKIKEFLFSLLKSSSFRRFVAMIIALVCAFLFKKFGVEISEETQARILDVIMLYIGQSGAVELAKVFKGVKVSTPPPTNLQEAAAVFQKGPQP